MPTKPKVPGKPKSSIRKPVSKLKIKSTPKRSSLNRVPKIKPAPKSYKKNSSR